MGLTGGVLVGCGDEEASGGGKRGRLFAGGWGLW